MSKGVVDVVVLDYGFGNVRSACRAIEKVGAAVELTGDPEQALAADGLVVPGVGAFAACVDGLRAVGGDKVIGRRLAGGRPVLGICVGMQVLFGEGVEHGVTTTGLDEWPGTVERLHAAPLPHMGWNTVLPGEGSRLFDGLDDARFYFVHSYGVRTWERRRVERGTSVAMSATSRHELVPSPPLEPPIVTWAEHEGDRFVAAVENGPLSATQFHPEKSADAGLALLETWVKGLYT
jgi:glutamine amidotransferase